MKQEIKGAQKPREEVTEMEHLLPVRSQNIWVGKRPGVWQY